MILWLLQLPIDTDAESLFVRALVLHLSRTLLLLLLRPRRWSHPVHRHIQLSYHYPLRPRLTVILSTANCDLPSRPFTTHQPLRQDGETRTRRWWKGAAAANQLHFQAPPDPRKGLDMVVRTAGHPH
jgi:hypothetical protein